MLLESLQMPLKCKSLEMLRGANKQQSLCFHLKNPNQKPKPNLLQYTHLHFLSIFLTLQQGSSDRQSSEDRATVGS